MKILNKTYPKDNKSSYIQKLINEELNIKVKKPTKIVISESKFKKIIKEELNAKLKKPAKIVVSESKLKKLIKEELNSLVESRKTEEIAMNALNKNNIPDAENLLRQFKEIDKTRSKNQILLPALAKAYIEHPNINDLRSVFEFIGDKIERNRFVDFVASKKGYMFNDLDATEQEKQQQFSDWLGLSGYVHQLQTAAQTDTDDVKFDVNSKIPPIWENDKFEIYDGTKKGNCIIYGEGGIDGKTHSFCIGSRSGAMHQSYRDTQASTFWYVFDKSRDLNDPLHLTVVDAVDPEWAERGGHNAPYLITDTDNNHPPTRIAEFGNDAAGYINYLKQNGVPVEKIMPHIPHSEEEKIALQLLKTPNSSLDWFKNLGAEAQKMGFGEGKDLGKLTYSLQSQYIGRGHRLSDEQFNYLWPLRKQGGAFNLLKQYVTTGMALPESQFNILVGESQ